MAVIIPDLFGAFQKGREYAIDRNWKDLENYETIEKMRTANDLSQLALLQERYYTPLKMSMFADNADNSAMQNQIQFTAYPGALSRARQYTNQAISDEAVQGATLPDTAQTQIGKTLSDNAMVRGQSAFNTSQAKNTDWEKNGASAAAQTNFKAGNAVKNAITEQEVWELAQQVRKYEYGDAIFKAGVNIALRNYYKELQELKAKGDVEGQKRLLERSMEEARGVVGNGNGQSFEVDLTQMTDAGLANLKRNAVAVLNKPDATPEEKFAAQRQITSIDTVFAGRGFTPTVERGPISLITNPSDNRLPMFRNAVPAIPQKENQTQNLTGGEQPQQTQSTSLVGGDINTHLVNVENDNSLSQPLRTAKLFAGGLERDSKQYNNWGGIFGEKDQPVRNILVNGVETPISNQTLDMLNSLNTKALSPNQLLIKNALLNNRAIQKTVKNGRVEFVPNQLIPMSYNNYRYSYTPNYSYTTPLGSN